ncbi:hypothetical protein T10_1028 [Trichinella papuae]|uniref:Uncharacterized protein n=1 Tax=Trichinella papuae TaxID=268474 RepID=A0A0V1MTH8_9BILA|nr:hypothetical protein T10_1028 [Trichinella papuae]
MPDGSLRETFQQGAARRLHLPSSRPLMGPSPGRTGIGDVVVSRLSKPESRSQSRNTVWRSKLPSRVPARSHPYVRNVTAATRWHVNNSRQSLAFPLPPPELHQTDLTASMRTLKCRPSQSDYGHCPENDPRTLGSRSPCPKTPASSVRGAFRSPLACCYCGGRGRWIWLNHRTRSLPFVGSSLVLLGEPSGSVR